MQISNYKTQQEKILCTTVMPTRKIPDMVEDIRESLLKKPRTLSPKYFYDQRGSSLFDQICSTPEYYPTRTENKILSRYGVDIINKTSPDQILELGSGYSTKTRRLFDACQQTSNECIYAPLDVCEEVLIESAKRLSDEYDWLVLNPLLGDYHAGLGNLPASHGTHLFVFLGSTIGNFEQEDALEFIKEVYKTMCYGDHLLIGVYNDAQGITAAFNLNMLHVLNRELNADFNIDKFTHSATFNADKERIEMRLISKAEQYVNINDLNESIQFNLGDDILTEVSQKYTYQGIEEMLKQANFTITDHYEDENAYFSLVLVSK
jgi:L-histidine N-alpha-methyltransferase